MLWLLGPQGGNGAQKEEKKKQKMQKNKQRKKNRKTTGQCNTNEKLDKPTPATSAQTSAHKRTVRKIFRCHSLELRTCLSRALKF